YSIVAPSNGFPGTQAFSYVNIPIGMRGIVYEPPKRQISRLVQPPGAPATVETASIHEPGKDPVTVETTGASYSFYRTDADPDTYAGGARPIVAPVVYTARSDLFRLSPGGDSRADVYIDARSLVGDLKIVDEDGDPIRQICQDAPSDS